MMIIMPSKIITISRQFGSGGRSVAKKLADRLGYAYYDKEIIDHVASETGFSKEFILARGEEAPGKSVFSYGFENGAIPGIMNGMTSNDYLWTIQRKVIIDIADKGDPFVIVGRSADYILRNRDNLLNVFIYADMDYRKTRVLERYGESETKIEKRLSDKDKKRSANHKHFTDLDWGYASNYDICLNTSSIGEDKVVDILFDIASGKE